MSILDLLHISEEGYDVLNADLKRMIIDSRYTHPKIVLGNDPSHFKFEEYTFGSEPANNSTTTLFTIPHGYDYVPMVTVQMRFSTGAVVNLPYIVFQITTGLDYFEDFFFYETDDTNVYIKLKRTLTGGSRPAGTNQNGQTYGFKRMIFAESGLEG